MIPIAEPDLTGNEQKYLAECISSGYVSSVGKFVNLFEKKIAESVEAKYCVAVNSGTSALHLSLLAAGVSQGDLVILPSLTFIASANAISYCGAEPWLFDISEDNWCLDAKLLEETLQNEATLSNGKLIHNDTGKIISAIMPVYTNGTPANIDEISKIAKQNKLPIIADAAAAIGAKYNGKQTGSLGVDLTCYSFNGNKTITSGGGGAIVSNDKKLIDYIRHISTTARVGGNYDHDVVGYNYRMTNLQAAVGCAQLERLQGFVENKKFINKSYSKIANEIEDISVFPANNGEDGVEVESACWLSSLLVDKKYNIENIQKYLVDNGVESRKFWKPIHMQKPYEKSLKTDMVICDNLWERILVLPSSGNMTRENINIVIDMVINALKNRS